MTEFNWQELLGSWQQDISQIYTREKEKWNALGLPPLEDLRIMPPDLRSVEAIERAFPWIDRGVLEFYKTTDGWPLWLGSFWCGIQPASDVDLFSREFPLAYQAALQSVDEVEDTAIAEISSADLEAAVVLSAPDSREFVLTTPAGASCLFLFDSVKVFSSFEALMAQRKRDVLDWVKEMLI